MMLNRVRQNMIRENWHEPIRCHLRNGVAVQKGLVLAYHYAR